jgi:hypothetical protein
MNSVTSKAMAGLGSASSAVTLPLWAVAGIALAFVLAAILAVRRAGMRRTGVTLVSYGLGLVALGTAWTFLDRWSERDRTEQWQLRLAERKVLDARALDLSARTLAPGSALACLDAVAGETVETECEKRVFGGPEATASAVAYVSLRLALLADGLDYARRFDAGYEASLAPWRRAAELDRYGLVAYVLATRDGCTPELCGAFALLRDSTAVKNNLRERTYDKLVAIYAEAWKQRQESPGPLQSSLPRGPAPVAKNIDFPSASSIPPISIMTPEPTGSVGAAASANATSSANSAAAKHGAAEPAARGTRRASAGERRPAEHPAAPAAAAPATSGSPAGP